jgi:uncharacterized membrane protein
VNQALPLVGWVIVTVVVVAIGTVVVFVVRRWAQRDAPLESFTIQDLREMRSRGEITESEFAAMRAALLSQMDLRASAGVGGKEPEGEQRSE